MIRTDKHKLLNKRPILTLDLFNQNDHGVVRVFCAGCRKVNPHNILSGTFSWHRHLDFFECPAFFRQLIRKYASGFCAQELASVLHSEFAFRHRSFLFFKETHGGDTDSRSRLIIECTGKAICRSFGNPAQSINKSLVKIIAFEASRCNGDHLGWIIREPIFNTHASRCITNGFSYRFQVVLPYFGSFVNHDNLCAISSECADRIRFNFRTILLFASPFTSVDLNSRMRVRINLAHDVRIFCKIRIYFLRNERCLFSRSANHGYQTSGILHTHCKTTNRRLPRLSKTPALHKIYRIAVTEHTCFNFLHVLELHAKVFFNKHILMGPPIPNLFNPQLCVFDLSNLLNFIWSHLIAAPRSQQNAMSDGNLL